MRTRRRLTRRSNRKTWKRGRRSSSVNRRRPGRGGYRL